MKSAVQSLKKSDALDLGAGKLAKVAEGLNVALANTYALYLKTQYFHWNAEGPKFFALHNLTEEHYQNMQIAIDDLAERIRAIGFYAPGSFKAFAKHSVIKDAPDQPFTDGEAIEMLHDDHLVVVRQLQKAIAAAEAEDDHPTADMLTERRAFHEKSAWMLRSLMK